MAFAAGQLTMGSGTQCQTPLLMALPPFMRWRHLVPGRIRMRLPAGLTARVFSPGDVRYGLPPQTPNVAPSLHFKRLDRSKQQRLSPANIPVLRGNGERLQSPHSRPANLPFIFV